MVLHKNRWHFVRPFFTHEWCPLFLLLYSSLSFCSSVPPLFLSYLIVNNALAQRFFEWDKKKKKNPDLRSPAVVEKIKSVPSLRFGDLGGVVWLVISIWSAASVNVCLTSRGASVYCLRMAVDSSNVAYLHLILFSTLLFSRGQV